MGDSLYKIVDYCIFGLNRARFIRKTWLVAEFLWREQKRKRLAQPKAGIRQDLPWRFLPQKGLTYVPRG